MGNWDDRWLGLCCVANMVYGASRNYGTSALISHTYYHMIPVFSIITTIINIINIIIILSIYPGSISASHPSSIYRSQQIGTWEAPELLTTRLV